MSMTRGVMGKAVHIFAQLIHKYPRHFSDTPLPEEGIRYHCLAAEDIGQACPCAVLKRAFALDKKSEAVRNRNGPPRSHILSLGPRLPNSRAGAYQPIS